MLHGLSVFDLLFNVLRCGDNIFLQYWQADIRERTGTAGFGRFDTRGVAAAEIIVHFFGHIIDKCSQFSG